jgi:hypothetical protein
MASVRATPEDFGIRVRSHPDMLVTGQVKMRNSYPLNLSYRGDISETIFFHRDADSVKRNFDITSSFLASLGSPDSLRGDSKPIRIWRNVSQNDVTEKFLASILVHPKAVKVVPDLIAQYIRTCSTEGELCNWTVVLLSKNDGDESEVGGHDVGLIQRAHYPKEIDPEEVGHYRVRRLVDPPHEYLDLTDQQILHALEATQADWEAGLIRGEKKPTRPSGLKIRMERPETDGLLLLYPLKPTYVESELPVLGFAFSFPDSQSVHTVNYRVNNVYYKQEYGEE